MTIHQPSSAATYILEMELDVEERAFVRLAEGTTEAIFVTRNGSWVVHLPSVSSGAVGLARRHIVTIRSLDDPSLVLSLPVDDEAVAKTLAELAALGSRPCRLSAVRRACTAIFAGLAPVIALAAPRDGGSCGRAHLRRDGAAHDGTDSIGAEIVEVVSGAAGLLGEELDLFGRSLGRSRGVVDGGSCCQADKVLTSQIGSRDSTSTHHS